MGYRIVVQFSSPPHDGMLWTSRPESVVRHYGSWSRTGREMVGGLKWSIEDLGDRTLLADESGQLLCWQALVNRRLEQRRTSLANYI